MIMKFMIMKYVSYKCYLLQKTWFFSGGNCWVCGGNSWSRGSFCRSAFWGKQTMLNISFRSRVFSSSTLMDGEDVVKTHTYENMDEKELEAELARLEDCIVFCSIATSFRKVFNILIIQISTFKKIIGPNPLTGDGGFDGRTGSVQTSCSPFALFESEQWGSRQERRVVGGYGVGGVGGTFPYKYINY